MSGDYLPMEQVAYTSADAANIPIPPAAQAGDLLVFWDAAASGINRGDVAYTLAGWERVLSENFNNPAGGGGSWQQNQVFVKVAEAGDGGSTVTGSNVDTATGSRRKAVLVFRGPRHVSEFSFKGFVFDVSASALPDLTVGVGEANASRVCIYMFRSGGAVTTNTVTPAGGGPFNMGGSTAAQVAYHDDYQGLKPDTVLGSDMNNNSNFLGGFYLEVR